MIRSRLGRRGNGPRTPRPAHQTVSPEERRFDLLAGTMFALFLALILNWGPPPLGWRVGDRPERDIDARAGYQYPDLAAQNDLEGKAREAAPNVYRRDDSALRAFESDLAGLLRAVKAADQRAALSANVTRVHPAITEADFRTLKAALAAETRDGQFTARVAAVLAALPRTGLIHRERYRTEVDERHEWITVVAEALREGDPARRAGVPLNETYRRDEVLVADDTKAVLGALRTEAEDLPDTPPVRQAVADVIAPLVAALGKPNLVYDPGASAQARLAAAARVGRVMRVVEPGQVIVKGGRTSPQTITPALLAELERERAAWLDHRPPLAPLQRTLALIALSFLMTALTGGLLWCLRPRILVSKPRLIVLGLLSLLVILAARVFQLVYWPIYAAPVALMAISLAIAYDQRLAFGMAFILSILAAAATTGELSTMLILLAGAAVGILGAREVRNRARLIVVGLGVGLASAVAVWATKLLGPSTLDLIAGDSLYALIAGVLTGFILTGGLPFLETVFKITTDISLLELTDANQPLLRQLALEAPGTYSHALVVSSLAEAAAEAIGARTLLARLGALFHDVGKIAKPNYFIENCVDQGSLHEHLRPTMSALVIVTHVKDGLSLAREHHLPRVIRDIIAEHHGTTLIEYFYHEAHREAALQGPDPEEALYRYPGPKPRSRESAIIMVADAVESASRPVRDPTPARLEGLVRDIVRRRSDDGQFEDCALTFKELAAVQATLIAALIRVYHTRIQYPAQATLEGRDHAPPANAAAAAPAREERPLE